MKVQDLMTPDPIVAEVPGNRRDVLRLLVKHSVSGLPVVRSRTRELAGVVTRSDLFAKPSEEQLALVMTSRPHVIAPGASVEDAARLFHDRRIHGLPVVEEGTLRGVISPTDLLGVMPNAKGRTVDQFISSHVVPVFEETPLPVAWQTMRLTQSNALPVMDADARLVGIVSDSDLFKLSGVSESIGRRELGLNEHDLDEERIRDIAPLYYAQSVLDLPKRPVKDIMVRSVITVFLKSTAEEAAQKMAKARINQLPVIDAGDKLVGLITDLDLMRAWLP
jgi:CBS domain-containing protein